MPTLEDLGLQWTDSATPSETQPNPSKLEDLGLKWTESPPAEKAPKLEFAPPEDLSGFSPEQLNAINERKRMALGLEPPAQGPGDMMSGIELPRYEGFATLPGVKPPAAVEALGGAYNTAAGLVSGLTSPASIGSVAAAAANPVLGKVIAGIWAAKMGLDLKGQVQEGIKAFEEDQPLSQKVEKTLNPLATLALGGFAGRAALKGTGALPGKIRGKFAELTKEKGVADAVKDAEAAQVHGDVPGEPAEGQQGVPAQEGGGGVSPGRQGEDTGQAGDVVLRPEESSAQKLGFTDPDAFKAVGKVIELRDRISNAFGTREGKQVVSATKDAADNQARIRSEQARNGLILEAKKGFGEDFTSALEALFPMVESGGDRALLQKFIEQTEGKAGAVEARRAAEFAEANWEALQPLAERFRNDVAGQRALEESSGIKVEERENYIPHIFDVDKLPDKGAEFFPSRGAGGGGGFRARRAFNTIYDAIEAGYGKALKSINAADVLQVRVKNGSQRVFDKAWVDSLRNVTDPTTATSLITEPKIDPNGVMLAPLGYELKTVLNGPPVAVHKGYGKLFDALTGSSQTAAIEMAGLPVGEAVLKTAAAIKHGTLLFDTFHASRMMQKALFLDPKKFGPQLLNPKKFGNKGTSLLEYAEGDLAEAVRQGDISPEIAKWVRQNRPTADLLIKRGLNVGQVHEALRSEVIKNIPVAGKFLNNFNKWVFEKVSRGALMEGALIEFERLKKAYPERTKEQIADKVAKDLNTYFGNLGRQGLFKSKTFQDLGRIILLAPNWVESMARSEAGGYGQIAKAALDTAKGKPKIGSLGKGMATGLFAYFVGAQVLNLITRGHPTWDNPEEGHKLDAWIPDLTGKTPGFFMSPMSVPAENTHDFLKYRSKKHDDSAEGAMQIAKNKMGPFSRAAYIMGTGDTYKGKVNGTWNRTKMAAMSLVPVPIAAGGFLSDKPGQAQRQLSSTLGFKIDPADTYKQRIGAIHSRWMQDNPDPKIRRDFERNLALVTPASDYKALDVALASRDPEGVAKAIAELRAISKDGNIVKRMDPFTLNGPKPLFHESQRIESRFLKSLSAEEKELYKQAKAERKAQWALFLKVWRQRPPRGTNSQDTVK